MLETVKKWKNQREGAFITEENPCRRKKATVERACDQERKDTAEGNLYGKDDVTDQVQERTNAAMTEEAPYQNEMQLVFDARSENEGFARVAVAAFISFLNPTMDELADIKTAVSEAVTNCIIHGYQQRVGKIFLEGTIVDRQLTVSITDEGVGIPNINQAMEPLFTTRPELERSGMGFSFMEAFMDKVTVYSSPGKGTRVVMVRALAKRQVNL